MLFTMISKNFLVPQEAKSVSVAGGQMVKARYSAMCGRLTKFAPSAEVGQIHEYAITATSVAYSPSA
jgi:hypothetical protein